MQQFNELKRSYYGYFITFIRTDLFNKIILKAVLNGNKEYVIDNYNLENKLKNELQRKNQHHYFNKYFNYRVKFFNKYFDKYKYDANTTIDLIYEYRNFLVDDISRLNKEKFPLILNKTLEEKEKDINDIILLLLSENILYEYSNYTNYIPKEKIINYQKYYFCQESEVIEYRKYTNKYFGFSNYNNKILFLERYVNKINISYAKKYQILIQIFNELYLKRNINNNVLIELNVKITKDYIRNSNGLLKIPVKNNSYFLMNFSQIFVLYYLNKYNKEYTFENFIAFIIKVKKLDHNKTIIIKSQEIFNFAKSYFLSLKDNRKLRKLIKVNYKPRNIDGSYLLKLIYAKILIDKNVLKRRELIYSKTFSDDLLVIEIIGDYYNNENISESVLNYLENEINNQKHLQEQLFGLLNQIKFTININEIKNLKSISKEKLLKINKDYKYNKKKIIKTYIVTMYILIVLKVHKYNENKKFAKLYIYRNNIMHFEKNLNYNKIDQEEVLKEIKILQQNENLEKYEVVFDNKFFNLLKIKNFDILTLENNEQ